MAVNEDDFLSGAEIDEMVDKLSARKFATRKPEVERKFRAYLEDYISSDFSPERQELAYNYVQSSLVVGQPHYYFTFEYAYSSFIGHMERFISVS